MAENAVMLIRRLAAIAGALALAALTVLRAQTPVNPAAFQPGDIVITGGQLFDGVRDTLVANTGIVVRHGVFLEVGASLTGRDLGPARVIQLDPDQTVLPGLF